MQQQFFPAWTQSCKFYKILSAVTEIILKDLWFCLLRRQCTYVSDQHLWFVDKCGLYEWRLYLSAGGEVLAGEGQVRLHCLAILTTSWRCCACSVDQSWQTSDWRAWTYNAGDIVKFVMANETTSNCKSANHRVTTCLENREMSGNLTAVREMSAILLKVWEMSGKILVREKLPKTVYCKLHICIHTGI